MGHNNAVQGGANMGDYKFDTFFYTEDGFKHHLSEIEDLPDETLITSYKGKMRCPECKGPQLSLVKKGEMAFLRTYPNQSHTLVDGEKCMYECNTASKKVMEQYVKELRAEKKIKSILEATLRRLLKQDAESGEKVESSKIKLDNPLLIKIRQSNGVIKRNIIPHYSFKSWGKNIPQDQLLIVYGKVYIELLENKKENENGEEIEQTYIHFKDIHTKKVITSCLKPQNLEVENGNYYAVILGKCHQNESNGHIYYNININFPLDESILLQKYQL